MAAAPVVIDDGGSTRIKQLIDNTDMDGLLDNPHQDLANGTFPANIGSTVPAKCEVLILTVTDSGTARAPINFSLDPDETAEIASGLGQTVVVRLNSGGGLLLDLNGPPDPVVEGRQIGRRRRYIITNAGPIQSVIKKDARGTVVGNFPVPAGTTYTMVRLG